MLLTVVDNGPGIPEPLRQRIFDPFFTTRATAGGIGLGLSVVEATMQAHGGSVSAGAAPSGGASFTLVLPAAPVSPTTAASPAAAQGTPA